MTKPARISIFTIIILSILIGIFAYFHFEADNTQLPTYFTYNTAELKPLRSMSSSAVISDTDLYHWDDTMFLLIKENKFGDAPAARTFAYIYTGQRDFAYLSHNLKRKYMGSIDAVTAKALCLFFPNNCNSIMSHVRSDDYSDKLTDIVIAKMKQRMAEDEKGIHSYLPPNTGQNWTGTPPYFGQEVGSWKTWMIGDVKNFVAPPPPPPNSPEWQHQLMLTKTALDHITPEQTQLVAFWAGNPGTVTPPGQWLIFANTYMDIQNVPLTEELFVRSVLAMTLADAAIAVFNSKYTYWVKRPFMLDPSIHTIMPTPNHPSYPAGHSTLSNAAATILIFYFPENKKFWEQNAVEGSYGRVWGGIHFTIDTEAGIALGKKVANAVIAKVKSDNDKIKH